MQILLEITVSDIKELVRKTNQIKEQIEKFICEQDNWHTVVSLKLNVENYVCELTDVVHGLRFVHPVSGWRHPFDRLISNYRTTQTTKSSEVSLLS